MSKHRLILLLFIYVAGIRRIDAFAPSLSRKNVQLQSTSSMLMMADSTMPRDKTMAIEEALRVTETFGIDSREAAAAWNAVDAIENSIRMEAAEAPLHDALDTDVFFAPSDADSPQYYTPTPPLEPPPSIPVVESTSSVSIADLTQEWAARNRDDWDTTDATRTTEPMASTAFMPTPVESSVEESPPPLETTMQEYELETTMNDYSDYNNVDDDDTQLFIDKLASVDKEIWYDEETGRFYEGSSLAMGASRSDMDFLIEQISTPRRFSASQGRAGFEDLQRQIESRNTMVEGEGRYAVADVEIYDRFKSLEMNDATMAAIDRLSGEQYLTDEEKEMLAEKIAKATEPRPYPLFLAEKATEFVETSVKGLAKPFQGAKPSPIPRELRKRIVVLGSGWGAASFLKGIDTDIFDVTVISPRNHFVFTPMLAGASVGTVEYRSITEPIREINRKAKFLEATATDVDPETQLVTCQSVVCDGNSCDIAEFTVRYDRLVITVGAQTNTFGIPGVREYCCFLKQVEDARRIRTAIVNCFERANLPGLTEEERKHDLTFAVIGAGPTGIEFAAELRDFIEQDGPKYYPNLVKYVRIKVIASSSTILAPFDKSLQEDAIAEMNRAPRIVDPAVRRLLPPRFKLTELLFESRVTEVTEKTILLKDGSVIPYGLAVWAAGNGPIPLTLHMVEELGEDQAKEQDVARGRIAVDPWLRAIGGKGKILAFGDCSCICQGGQQLPATAQVASQQGEYLASTMNRKFDMSPTEVKNGVLAPPMIDRKLLSDCIAGISTKNVEYAKPFQFLNLGILAYTGGGSALSQVETAPEAPPVLASGKVGNLLWRSVYLSKQVSGRNRLLVLNDWAKKQLFGRDITRV